MSYADILDRSPSRMRADQTLLLDLIAVLTANKAGLRRWSVMRAMRQRAEKANREVTPKFEDDVERAFGIQALFSGHGAYTPPYDAPDFGRPDPPLPRLRPSRRPAKVR